MSRAKTNRAREWESFPALRPLDSSRLLLGRFGLLDKGSHVIVELLQDAVVHIDHVPGRIVAVADIGLERIGNGQVVHLKLALKVRRRRS